MSTGAIDKPEREITITCDKGERFTKLAFHAPLGPECMIADPDSELK